jgi:tRNA threonylcarbamoyladenosine modification (KEOPS) complex  Pcc1 subunit
MFSADTDQEETPVSSRRSDVSLTMTGSWLQLTIRGENANLEIPNSSLPWV